MSFPMHATPSPLMGCARMPSLGSETLVLGHSTVHTTMLLRVTHRRAPLFAYCTCVCLKWKILSLVFLWKNMHWNAVVVSVESWHSFRCYSHGITVAMASLWVWHRCSHDIIIHKMESFYNPWCVMYRELVLLIAHVNNLIQPDWTSKSINMFVKAWMARWSHDNLIENTRPGQSQIRQE